MDLKEMVVSIWNDPVFSKVIAVFILSVFSVIFIFFRKRFSLLLRRIRQPNKCLVFLSSGGTCRDPIAKAIMERLLEKRNTKYNIMVFARALYPTTMTQASKGARYAIKEIFGQDLLDNHIPEQLTQNLIDQADLILAMDHDLISAPKGKVKLPQDKTYTVKQYFGEDGDIEDPYPDGTDPATLARYKKCAEELNRILSANVDSLLERI